MVGLHGSVLKTIDADDQDGLPLHLVGDLEAIAAGYNAVERRSLDRHSQARRADQEIDAATVIVEDALDRVRRDLFKSGADAAKIGFPRICERQPAANASSKITPESNSPPSQPHPHSPTSHAFRRKSARAG